jgi:hypothetical protein
MAPHRSIDFACISKKICGWLRPAWVGKKWKSDWEVPGGSDERPAQKKAQNQDVKVPTGLAFEGVAFRQKRVQNPPFATC